MDAEDDAPARTPARELVTHKVPAAEGYRIWARTYDDALNPIVSLIDRHLEIPPGLVIDVACGTGRWIERTRGFGADLSSEMLAKCRGRAAQSDARMLPFPTGVADVAMCILALGYISPPETVLEEMQRITRAGGTIICADLHPLAIEAGWTRSFRDGSEVYEIENRPFRPDGAIDLYFGEAERAVYERAGRAALFEQVRSIPAAWMKRWTR